MFKYLAAALPVLFLSFTSAAALTSNFKIDAVSAERNATIHIPDQVIEDELQAPVVFAFHGPGSSSTLFEKRSQIIEEADRKGYIVVIPNGSKRENYKGSFWNVSPFLESSDDYALETDEDFIRIILDFLEDEGHVDRGKIFAAGFSMGGMMAYKLGCKMSEVFSGVAVVAGAMTTADCNPTMPVSLFHLHGMSDERVPYFGGQPEGGIAWPDTMATIRSWEARTQCGEADTLPVGEEGMCRRSVCEGGNVVKHCAGYEMGHVWSGRKQTRPEIIAYGESKATAFNATKMIFEFFDEVPGREVEDEDLEEIVEGAGDDWQEDFSNPFGGSADAL